MLKITLKPGSGFNVAFNGKPVEHHYLKMDDDTYSKVDLLLHSLREEGCDSEIAHLEYLDGCVVFYRHVNGRSISILLSDNSIWDLLAYLAEMRATLKPFYSEDVAAT